MPYHNPVIPGFYPDPSVCWVGEDYYLVTSSFEYFPGVPVFHSRDLINWRQVGHCLTRESQLPLAGIGCSGGIYAPTIRYRDGLYSMTTTNVGGRGNFFVTAKDPAGPWSEPVWVNRAGIDPTIYFDDDGLVYYLTDGQQLSTIDITAGDVTSEVKSIWSGTGGSYPEAPHLYKVCGWYYLMIAEGGTSYGHRVTIARSRSVWGPYESCPHNPILGHSHLAAHPIQCTGHADLIHAHDGSWWMVFLATRPHGNVAHLGRETFLAPVTWTADGWPLVNGGRPVDLNMDVPTLPLHPWPTAPAREDFNGQALGLEWNYLRNPAMENYSHTARPGWLRLKGTAATLNEHASPTFVGRRQQHFACAAAVLLDFDPSRDGEEAGLTIVMNDTHHLELGVTQAGGHRIAFARRRLGSLNVIVAQALLAAGPVELSILAEAERYTLRFRHKDDAWVVLDTPETRYVSAEVARTFTGVYLGMYATGNGKASAASADFDWFDYQPLETA